MPPLTPDSKTYKAIGLLKQSQLKSVSLVEEIATGNRYVAHQLKTPSTLTKEAAATRLTQEAEALMRVTHPNVPHFMGYQTTATGNWFLFEYLDGYPLSQHKGDTDKVPDDWLMWWFWQIVVTVDQLHQNRVVIGGFEPKHFLVHGDKLYLVHVGILENLFPETLALLRSPDRLTFTAPEHRHSIHTSVTGDLYSAGALAFWLCTGKAPAFGTRVEEEQVRGAIAQSRRNFPPAVSTLICRLLQFQAAQRPQTATEVVEALRAFTHDLTGGTPPAPVRPYKVRFFGRETSARLTTEAVEMEKKAGPPKAQLLSPEAASAKTPMSLDTKMAQKANEAATAAPSKVPDTSRRPPAMPAPPTGPTMARAAGTPPAPNWPPKANPLDVNTVKPQPVANPLDSHTTRPSGAPVSGLGVDTGQGPPGGRRGENAGPSGVGGGPPRMPTGGGSRAFGPSNTEIGGGSRAFGPSSTDLIRNRTSSHGAEVTPLPRTPDTARPGRIPSQGAEVARSARVPSQGTASEAPRTTSGAGDTPTASDDSTAKQPSAFQEFMEDVIWSLFRKNPMVTFILGLIVLLAIGFTIYLLAPGAKPQAVATGGLTLVAGHIEIKASSDQSGGFVSATTVTTPDSIIEATQSNGPTVLHFGDASTLRLDEHTMLVFKGWSNHTLTIQLSQGHAFVEPGAGESAEVHAAGAIVDCPPNSGAEFTLGEPNGEPHHPQVKTTQGSVQVRTGGGDSTLTAGKSTDLPDAMLPTDSGAPAGGSGSPGESVSPHF